MQVYSAVLKENSGWPCSNVKRGLQFLEYIHSDADRPETGDIAQAMGIQWLAAPVRQATQAALEAVTCDGDTLLVTRPVAVKISSAVASACLAITVVGCIFGALTMLVIWVFHRRTTFRSSSPFFLLYVRKLSDSCLLLVFAHFFPAPSR